LTRVKQNLLFAGLRLVKELAKRRRGNEDQAPRPGRERQSLRRFTTTRNGV
jgi:hypothetical protein